MANPNAPFGLRAKRHYFGGVVRPNEYHIADQYGTALYMGDPVLVTGTADNIGIASAGNSDVITGVFAGCEYVNLLGDTIFSEYWPAAQATNTAYSIKSLIYDDPFIVYEVQFDATGLANTDIRKLANLHAGVGSAVTRLSGWYASNPPGAGENQVKILRLSNSVNAGGIQNAYGAYCVADVLLARSEFSANMVSE